MRTFRNFLIASLIFLSAGAYAQQANPVSTNKPNTTIRAGYWLSGNNSETQRTTFDNSPSQEHDLKTSLSGITLGASRDMRKNLSLGVDYFHGEGEDSGTFLSEGTPGLTGESRMSLKSKVDGLEVYGEKRLPINSRLDLNGRLGLYAANMEAKLSGKGDVASDSDFAFGSSLSSKASGTLYGLSLGAGLNAYLNRNVSLSAGLGYRLGNELDFDKARSEVSINGEPLASGEGRTKGEASLNGLSGYLGLGFKF